MTEQELQIALFIDTDQQGAALLDVAREICLQSGRLVIVKAYGDFSCSMGTAWVAQSKRHNMVDLHPRVATHGAGGRACIIRPRSSVGQMQRANAAGTKLLGANANIFLSL